MGPNGPTLGPLKVNWVCLVCSRLALSYIHQTKNLVNSCIINDLNRLSKVSKSDERTCWRAVVTGTSPPCTVTHEWPRQRWRHTPDHRCVAMATDGCSIRSRVNVSTAEYYEQTNVAVTNNNTYCGYQNISIARLRENLTPEALRYGSHSFYPANTPYPLFTS